jgi:hypothetical protein
MDELIQTLLDTLDRIEFKLDLLLGEEPDEDGERDPNEPL